MNSRTGLCLIVRTIPAVRPLLHAPHTKEQRLVTGQDRPISEMKNLGPKTSLWLAEIDIHSERDLRSRGIIDAYIELKGRNPRGVNLMMLWAMQGALMDINCLYLPDEIKTALKQELLEKA